MQRIIGILLLSCAVMSCTTLTAPPPASTIHISWQDREPLLNRLQSWDLSGKIAMQSTQDAGTASVNWRQKSASFAITLAGPLGSNSLHLVGKPGSVYMQTANGQSLHANTPEVLVKKAWGFNLPVSNLRYWIRGLPVPQVAANSQFDATGRLQRLTQQGFVINYLNYTHVNAIDLPQRISITSPSLKIKMIIYRWQIGNYSNNSIDTHKQS